MKFIILVKATAESEAGQMPGQALIAKMAAFHGELARAGVLVDATGLRPSATGWRVRYDGDVPALVEGPFAEANLVSGFTIINVASREEAIAWTRRYPNPAVDGKSGEIEVRPYFDLADFGDTPAVDHFRELCAARAAEDAHA